MNKKSILIKSLLGIATGFLLIVSFPKADLWFCAWVSFIPLLISLKNTDYKQSFFIGFFSGFAACLGIFYWIVVAIVTDGNSIFLGLAGLGALSAYMALYYGIFAMLFSWGTNQNFSYVLPFYGACLWVVLEYIRMYLFTGFPWLLLGYSQWQVISVIHIARFGGVYIISFLIMWGNIVLFQLMHKKNYMKPKYMFQFLTCAVCIALIAVYGKISAGKIQNDLLRSDTKSVSFSLLQGNIDQYRKWDETYEKDIYESYQSLTWNAVLNNPELIIWPETSFPGFFEEREKRSWLNNLVKSSKTFHLVSAASVVKNKYYNSAFLLDPAAKLAGKYNKKHLVLFGEKVPFAGILGKFIKVLNDLGGFNEGQGKTIIPYTNGNEIRILGVSICFEAIFPGLIRQSVKDGAQVLINLTNDAWYLKSAAGYQHLIMNVFRAVENNRYLLRCANTGISAVIDPTGRIVSQTKLFERTFLPSTCSLNTSVTFYTKRGDIFVWVCLIFLAALCIFNIKSAKRIFFD
ncbi:MAG: apolipoprotein N-acyltransferase [bacterium]